MVKEILFKSSTNQAPTKFQSGEECEEKILWLRLKLIADIGLVGLPNAGKSTFMSRLTASKNENWRSSIYNFIPTSWCSEN